MCVQATGKKITNPVVKGKVSKDVLKDAAKVDRKEEDVFSCFTDLLARGVKTKKVEAPTCFSDLLARRGKTKARGMKMTSRERDNMKKTTQDIRNFLKKTDGHRKDNTLGPEGEKRTENLDIPAEVSQKVQIVKLSSMYHL